MNPIIKITKIDNSPLFINIYAMFHTIDFINAENNFYIQYQSGGLIKVAEVSKEEFQKKEIEISFLCKELFNKKNT